jgi:hypothetical protein
VITGLTRSCKGRNRVALNRSDDFTQLLLRAADREAMNRRTVVRLRRRLDASPLPQLDPVRLHLDEELVELEIAAQHPPTDRALPITLPLRVTDQ